MANASKDLDWYKTLSDWSGWKGYSSNHSCASSIAEKANEFIDSNRNRSFFLFIHFTDPDTEGHRYGENSRNYSNAIKEADAGLGIVIQELEKLGIYEETTILVTTDHGFNENGETHERAPDTLELWIASNNKNAISRGTIAEQSSITPTILEIFGIEVKPFSFDGESLASRDALQAKPAPGFDFISALAGAAILIFLLRS